MTANHDEALQSLVAAVTASAKYRQVSPDLIAAVGRRELAIRSSWKEALKATKSKLHQVAGAYQDQKIDYNEALNDLNDASGSAETFRETCRRIMGSHASTRERLSILDQFFEETLTSIGPICSVVDIACGLNPLAWSWMPLCIDVEYVAYDIYKDTMQFIAGFMQIAGINGHAEVRDVLSHPPEEAVDLALILKTLPCLEQLDKSAAFTLLDAVKARNLLISYPVRSLGGRRKGMVGHYDAHFAALATHYQWTYQRFEFSTELAFLVKT